MSDGAGRRRRLVLHVDLNNTVVVADTVTGQAPRAALNTFLSTVTWGRAGAAGERRGGGYGGPGVAVRGLSTFLSSRRVGVGERLPVPAPPVPRRP